MAKDYYKILGVERNVDDKTLKKKFRELSLKYHPDRQGDKTEQERKEAEEKFKDIAEAYSVLSDSEKRKNYDTFGSADGKGSYGFDFNMDDILKNMMGDDFFGGFGSHFGGNRRQQQQQPKQQRGKMKGVKIQLSLEEIYVGGIKKVSYKVNRPCTSCTGKGSTDGVETVCPQCGGTGKIFTTQSNGWMTTQQISTCQHCNGSGSIIKNPCHKCNGTGLEEVAETWDFEIPKNFSYILNGTHFTIPGKGHSCERGKGPNGDLTYVFSIQEDDAYTLVNNGVIREIYVNIFDCINGRTNVYEHLDTHNGHLHYVTIPFGCKDGEIIETDGKGFDYGNGVYGKLYFRIHHKMPEAITDKGKKLIEKLKNEVTI